MRAVNAANAKRKELFSAQGRETDPPQTKLTALHTDGENLSDHLQNVLKFEVCHCSASYPAEIGLC
jgi:hypothetical protein